MALITSAATGNFNAPGTWTGGVVPGAGDEARVSNGHVVTISANATATLLSNNGTGYFVLNSGVTLTANVTNATGSTQNNPCVRFTSASPASATIVGNLTATGGSSNAHAVQNSSTGTLNITGNVTGGSAQTSNGVVNTTTGTVNITGNCTGGTFGNCWAVNNTNGQIVVTGNVTGGSATGGVSFPSAISNDSGTVTVTGIVSAGSIASAHGILNNSTGSVTVVGEVVATNGAHGISSTNASSVVRASGSMTYSANGTLPIMANRFFLNATPTQARTRYALNGSSTFFNMSGADVVAAGGVATSDVRSGVTYAGLTGTCAVPPAASVSLGVPVDNTTGTAVLTGSDIATAVWGAATRSITGGTVDTATTLTNSPDVPTEAEIAAAVRSELSTELGRLDAAVSSRLAPSGTLATVTTLTNAPSVPTPAEIASQVRTELATELARVDAAVSTRLASSAYTAPANSDISAIKAKTDSLPASPAAVSDIPTTSQISAAVEGSLLNEGDGQAVLNAIVGAIGNTNLSEVSLVAAVRADLERTGGKLDSIPTTGAPTAAQNATAVWGAATKEITGGTVTTLTNAPSSVTPSDIWSYNARTLTSASGPTATEIRQEMDSNSTKLANLDAAVSSRLAGSAYSAPATPPTAVQIRQEIDANSTKLDVAVSSRLAASESTKLDAVKAKTDALNTERLANVATTAIVGNLIAQANS